MAKTDLKSMTLEEMQDFFATIGEPKFRAKQVFQWLHDKRVKSFDEMTNLSKQLREKLSQETKISNLKIVDKLQSQKDGTTKYLFALDNDNVIESVLMRYSYGNAVCVSSRFSCIPMHILNRTSLDGWRGLERDRS